MGAEAGDDQIEARLGEGKLLRRATFRLHILEATAARLLFHRSKHLRGHVIGRDGTGMRGHGIGRMASAAADVERARRLKRPGQIGQFGKILALRMNAARDIVLGTRPKLPRNQIAVFHTGHGFLGCGSVHVAAVVGQITGQAQEAQGEGCAWQRSAPIRS